MIIKGKGAKNKSEIRMEMKKGEQGNRTSPSEWQVTISRHRKSMRILSIAKAMVTLMPQGR